jgi:hypothetical protein
VKPGTPIVLVDALDERYAACLGRQDKACLEFEIGYGDFEHLAASLCARLGNV